MSENTEPVSEKGNETWYTGKYDGRLLNESELDAEEAARKMAEDKTMADDRERAKLENADDQWLTTDGREKLGEQAEVTDTWHTSSDSVDRTEAVQTPQMVIRQDAKGERNPTWLFNVVRRVGRIFNNPHGIEIADNKINASKIRGPAEISTGTEADPLKDVVAEGPSAGIRE